MTKTIFYSPGEAFDYYSFVCELTGFKTQEENFYTSFRKKFISYRLGVHRTEVLEFVNKFLENNVHEEMK